MYVLVTKKNEDQIKKIMRYNGQDIIELYFRHSRAANSIVGGQVWPKIKLIKAFIVLLDIFKNDEDPSKNESTKCAHNITPIISLWRFFSDIQGQLTP